MSDRDDFDDLFGDDPFGDDDFDTDDDFMFEDDNGAAASASFENDDEFSFEDDDLGGFDDSFDDDFDMADELDEDFLAEDDGDDGGGGPNRTFVILAGLMIFLFVIGLGVVIFLALSSGDEDDPFDLTSTAIFFFNETQVAFLGATQTQQITDVAGTQTQVAENENATGTAIVVATEDAIGSATAEAELATQNALATLDAEEDANAQATADAQATFDFLTQQAGPPGTEEPVETEDATPGEIDVNSVAQTATAIAEIINRGTPTPQEGGTGGQVTRPTPVPGQLPETGFLGDGTNSQSIGAMLLVAFGLVGVIFGARRLRTMNTNAADKEQSKA